MTEKIYTSCEFNLSKFCKKSFYITKYNYLNNIKNNNGKFRCKYCAIEMTHKGEKSHFFKYLKNENYFDVIDDDVKAYLLGVLAGDGHISEKIINLVANKKDIETINLLISKIYISNIPLPLKHKSSNCYYINITSENLAKNILNHLKINPGKKSNNITLPLLDRKLSWAFIRGFFDTDGCINSIYAKQTSPQCFCSSNSFIILKQIQSFCMEENIIGHINGVKLKFNGKNAINFMRKIYENAECRLTRKYDMFKLWESWQPRKGNLIKSFDTRSKRRILQDSDVIYILSSNDEMIDLSKKFHVATATIHDIRNKKIYKEIKI